MDHSFSAKHGIMDVNKDTLIAMKGKNWKFYTLWLKTILGEVMKVELCHKESFANVKKDVRIEEKDKMIKTLFSTENTY